MKVPIFLVLILAYHAGESAKILHIYSMPSVSHYNLNSAYYKALANAGHDVTVIAPYEETEVPKNGSIRTVLISGIREELENKMKGMNFFENRASWPFASFLIVQKIGWDVTHYTLSHPNVQAFMKSNETFDLVIYENFYNDAFVGFAHHFNCPYILFLSVGAGGWINSRVANPSPSSYVPSIELNYLPKMSYTQRFVNFLYSTFTSAWTETVYHKLQENSLHNYFPEAPALSDLKNNVSLVMVNGHPSISQPVPLVPNIIEIGGYHLKPSKPLPKDLQEYLDGAKEGVIYFSMGSNLKSKDMPLEKQKLLLKVFSTLKQKVLWKYEDELKDLPKNVKIMKWLPQQDILAHPNVKLFISHGGMLSSTETIFHGVPILAMPMYGDQMMNALNAQNNGFALVLSFHDLTESALSDSIHEIISNPKYTENVKARSKIMKDRIVSPLETVVYWTEYVLRHKGASHLRVQGTELPWYQYYLIDVLATIFVLLLVLALASKRMITCLWKKPSSKKPKKKRS